MARLGKQTKGEGTIQNRLKRALEAQGWEVDPAHVTSKYVAMKPLRQALDENPHRQGYSRYFLGRAGTLRYAACGRVTRALTADALKARLLGESSPAVALGAR